MLIGVKEIFAEIVCSTTKQKLCHSSITVGAQGAQITSRPYFSRHSKHKACSDELVDGQLPHMNKSILQAISNGNPQAVSFMLLHDREP